ncbi:hypothetical protein GALMADRAFT_858233 [Galerina marginata CBS 339.88]|uniref:UBC core domain-containing protein n=1 Tax=Galerina marginata (strain CBS 339.88) TaxID=685588 RepID=A0A067TID4_GALM3|nr:hypothetical protein GALMADRAFT_858233 [Galerina marginata CBS 339.88]
MSVRVSGNRVEPTMKHDKDTAVWLCSTRNSPASLLDLGELQDNPYPGVAVFTDDANFRKLCLVLTPPSGPWTDLALHFDVVLPENWPKSPPSVASSVNIEHPNLYGSYICCDLLKPEGSGGPNYTGGYSPALTLRGLFLQFLTFFSSTKIEQDYGGFYEVGDHTTVCYLPEDNAKTHKGICPTSQTCSCNFAPYQELLANLWKADPSNAVQINTWKRGDVGFRGTESVKRIPGLDQLVHKVEWLNPRWTSTLGDISYWTCKSCPYGSHALPHHRIAPVLTTTFHIPAILLQPPSACQISILNDDTLADVASYLTSESVISLSIAYPRFRKIMAYLHVLLRRELNCFFLRTPLNETILGVGVSLDEGARSLSSDFDWLSMEAFDIFGVRKSIQKRPFNFFLPLPFNRPHFTRAQVAIWDRLTLIDTALCKAEATISRKTKRPSNRRLGPPLKPHHTVEVLYRMMNNIVTSLMKSCDDTLKPTNDRGYYHRVPTLLHASEKAVISYCHLFHLLIRLSSSTAAILQDATWKLRDFIAKPETRLKNRTPDMGELIVLMMLVLILPPVDAQPLMQWESICGNFLQEAITRNVRWVLAEAPELEVMETGANDYRLNQTFNRSKTSLRLIMFQISFLRMFINTYSSNLSQLDDNYGFADKELPERMVVEIKEIYEVDTWPKFFQRVRYTEGQGFSKATFSEMLRATVQQSAAHKYHNPSNSRNLEQLKAKRATLEKAALGRS